MQKETLKWLRTYIPGILFLIIPCPWIITTLGQKEVLDWLMKYWSILLITLPLLIYFIGGIYYVTGIRNILFPKFVTEAKKNIKNILLEYTRNDPVVKANAEKLQDTNTLMQVFYNIIDNDESLKNKAYDVYFNGLIWSTSVDLTIVSATGFVVYFLALYIVDYDEPIFAICALIFSLSFTIFNFWFIPLVIEKHIRLSNSQLKYIRVVKYKRLIELLHIYLEQDSSMT